MLYIFRKKGKNGKRKWARVSFKCKNTLLWITFILRLWCRPREENRKNTEGIYPRPSSPQAQLIRTWSSWAEPRTPTTVLRGRSLAKYRYLPLFLLSSFAINLDWKIPHLPSLREAPCYHQLRIHQTFITLFIMKDNDLFESQELSKLVIYLENFCCPQEICLSQKDVLFVFQGTPDYCLYMPSDS